MVEKVMVGGNLSDEMIKAGEELVKRLDKSEFRVKAAFWFFQTDNEVWRLIIASPKVKDKGPRQAYKSIQEIVKQIPSQKPRIELQNISVVDSSHHLVSLLKSAIKTGTGISGIRFSQNTINGEFIEDAYIYRLT